MIKRITYMLGEPLMMRLHEKLRVDSSDLPPSEREGEDSHVPGGGTETLTRPESRTKTPSFYKVLLLNDDFTPREFVVHVLQQYFKRSENDAIQIMLHVHHKGVGVAGIYTFEIAETKAFQVNEYSKKNKYPLKCTTERE